MKNLKNVGYGALILVGVIALVWIFGLNKVFYTKTIGKQQKNAEREVYEETNSFTKAKRQEAIKLFKEYNEAESLSDKKSIEKIAAMSFADLDEDKFITDPTLLAWIKKVKY